jgi:endonuclease/exonuclease/phosphatase family metal-dependent hydrolase
VSTRAALRAALLACALALTAAAPASADVTKRIFSFNMCGAAEGCPNDGDQRANDGVIQAIESSIANFDPEVVALQEVCKGQYEVLKQELSDGTGVKMEGRFAIQNFDADRCNDDSKDFGVAIFSKAAILEAYPPVTIASGEANPPEDTEQRKLLCVKVNWVKHSRVCSTHLSNTSGTNSEGITWQHAQARKIADVVNPWVNGGHPVIVAGDFNAVPHPNDELSLNPMYIDWLLPRDSGNGVFEEVDEHFDGLPNQADPDPACRCGEASHRDGKLDYIFVSAPQFKVPDDIDAGNATDSDYSDHDPIRGIVTLISP